MRSETKADDEDEVDGIEKLVAVEKEMEEMVKRGCCCPIRKRKNQAKVKDEKKKKHDE